MLFDLDSTGLVIRRLWQGSQDEIRVQYRDGDENWVDDPKQAWLYGNSTIAFTQADDCGGEVFIRLPSGKELAVERKDFEK